MGGRASASASPRTATDQQLFGWELVQFDLLHSGILGAVLALTRPHLGYLLPHRLDFGQRDAFVLDVDPAYTPQ